MEILQYVLFFFYYLLVITMTARKLLYYTIILETWKAYDKHREKNNQ